MEFKRITKNEAAGFMAHWKEDPDGYLKTGLDPDAQALRDALIEGFDKFAGKQKYVLDYRFGMWMRRKLEENGFTLRNAADDGVWMYLSLRVAPDLVEVRWDKDAEIRYYKQSGRIWLKTLWWYIYLSWQGNVEKTLKILETNSTDQILQLVDRTGKKGYYVDVYRKIMYYYWYVRQTNNSIGEAEFRRIMTLHTAMCKSIEPGLCEGGYDGYVRMLFSKVGVVIN